LNEINVYVNPTPANIYVSLGLKSPLCVPGVPILGAIERSARMLVNELAGASTVKSIYLPLISSR
jgi:hypothetical protein